MAERIVVSDEAKRMCRQCTLRNEYDGRCNLRHRTIETQNKLAENGECDDAKIRGVSTLNPGVEMTVSGKMINENGDWIFQGGMPMRN